MAKIPQAAGLHRASLPKLHDLDAALEWPVLKGPMLRIFVIDAALFVANVAVALLLASRA